MLIKNFLEKLLQIINLNKKNLSIIFGLIIIFILIYIVLFHEKKEPLEEVKQIITDSIVDENTVLDQPQGDILETISFENIPEESFVPEATGKIIRVNIVAGEIKLYENGTKVGKDMRMMAKPQKNSYWETPGGIYHISGKDENYYSERALAWLPYSIHLFGNYIIHGVPNDGKGRIYNTSFRNGGIRLSDEDARTLFIWTDTDTKVSIYSDSMLKPEQLYTGSVYITENGSKIPLINAEAYLVGDIETGDIILEKNKDKIYPMASITKLTTLLVALDKENPFEMLPVTKQALSAYGTYGFRIGEEIEMMNVVYSLLLVSSNDAAEILAEYVGRNEFIKLMNEKVKTLGMTKTFFDDPSGLSAKNKTSVEDLFKLAQYITKEKPFIWKITNKKTYSINGHNWRNINQFLRINGHIGGKSGQTDEARQTNIEIFSIPLGEGKTRKIAIILLRTPNRYSDTISLYNYVKKNITFGRDGLFTFAPKSDDTKEVKLSFAGDIMLDRGVKLSIKQNFDGDYSKLFQNLNTIKDSDIMFANLEGPISSRGTDSGNFYSFRMDPKVTEAIKNSGIDILNIANNHIADWGEIAFTDTLNNLHINNIQSIGGGLNHREATLPVIIEKQGMKIGYLGFSDVGQNDFEVTDKKPGILFANDPDFDNIIANAKKKVDFLVVSMHWGTEYASVNRRQEELAHRSINAGANLVVGHNPHVIQDTELYKGGVIIYSLGNFIFDQGFSKEVSEGLVVNVTLDAKSKKIKRFDKYKVTQNEKFIPSELKPFNVR